MRYITLGMATLALLALSLSGCSRSKTPYPVKGQVLDSKGKPAVGALIFFYPVGNEDGPKPVGRVDETGTFHLTTDNEGDGAPAGEYGVRILWPTPRKRPFDPEGPDQLNGSYADPKNPRIRFTVEKKPDNEVPTIRLP